MIESLIISSPEIWAQFHVSYLTSYVNSPRMERQVTNPSKKQEEDKVNPSKAIIRKRIHRGGSDPIDRGKYAYRIPHTSPRVRVLMAMLI